MKRTLLSLTLLLFSTTPAIAELAQTDRPDSTESTSIVAPLSFQFETGYTFTYNRLAGGIKEKTHTLPELLLRTGISKDIEFRLFFEGYNKSRTSLPGSKLSDNGYTDLNVGTKINLV